MIIDAHNSVIPWDEKACEILFPPKVLQSFRPCSYENILSEMDRLKIDRLVTWNVATRPELSSLCNDWTAKVRERNPSRFIGFCCVHPTNLDEAIREMERSVRGLGLSGLKLHPQVQGISMADPNLIQLLHRAKELNLPVVIHVNPPVLKEYQALEKENSSSFVEEDFLDIMRSELSDQAHLKAVIKTYNSSKVMAAHMGGAFLKEALDSKISFQTTGASQKVIEWACKRIGADRVMFGTDFPFFRMDLELEKVKTADLSKPDKEKVLSGNILKILER
jgi:predicted TIM-barrel fold metal-dependent hydrolase